MEGDYVENIRTDTEYLDYKISCLDEDRIQAAWKRLQDHVKHLNHLLVTERMDRQKEREQAERIRKVERGQWTVKEACLVLRVEKLSAELKTKDWLWDRAREMEEASSERAVRLKDREAAEALEKEHLEAQMKQRIEKLLEANEQLQGELLMREEEIEEVRKMWEAEKKKVEKIWAVSDELRSKNLEVNAKYKAIMKQKMEELEREREMMRDPVAAIRQSEDRILSAVPLVIIQKNRMMQELQNRVSPIPSENMSKVERRKWKEIQKKKAKELKTQKKAEDKKRKEASKDAKVKSKEKKSFWKRLWCCKGRESEEP